MALYMDKHVWPHITVKKLKEILNTLPEDNLVNVNQVGNLSIHTDDGSEWLGWIDISFEEYENCP
jgi:hypothetical protein